MDNVQEQSNRTSDISHTRVMVARTNIVLSVLETTDPGLYWGGNYCCVVVGWYAVSCRCGGRARGLPLLCFRVSRVSRVCRGVVVCGVSGGMGTAPAGFGSCRGRRVTCWCGGVLLSHILSDAVPSPCQVFASGFGMGPGVSPGPWPPQICNYHPTGSCVHVFPYGGLCGGLGTGWWTRVC